MDLRRFIIPSALVIVLTVALIPIPAHAGLLSMMQETSKTLGSVFMDIGAAIFDAFSNLLISLLKFFGTNLQSVISWNITYGGATVYKMWDWIRDLCSMFFVVVLIIISFGTIFNTLKPNAFHARQSIAMFIAAAILINLSLAVGQTIVWTGNRATQLVLGFMPQDVGAQIATQLQVIGVAAGTSGKVPSLAAPSGSIPLDKLPPGQRLAVVAWQTKAAEDSAEGAGSRGALTVLQSCLQANQLPIDCYTKALKAQGAAATKYLDEHQSLLKNIGNRIAETVWRAQASDEALAAFDAVYGSSGLSTSLSQFSHVLVRFFLLLVMSLSFIAIVLFMVVRIPIVWFLLAVSPAAFFALAVPPAKPQFMRWFGNLVGICAFGPLYLMVIYLGLFVLSTQGTLISAGADINDLPLISSLFGTAFFTIIAAFIFIGGAGMVTKFAFRLSPLAGSVFGTIGGALGVSEKTGFGVRTVGRGLGAITGATTATRGLREGAKERYERVVQKPLAARQERLEAGVRTMVAGGEARQKYLQSRIDDRTKRLDQQLQKQLDRARIRIEQATAAEARASDAMSAGRASVIELHDAQIARAKAEQALTDLQTKQANELHKLVTGTGKLPVTNETAIAAGNILLKTQKITSSELMDLQERYAKVSAAALQGFIKQRDEQLQKDAGTRKYDGVDDLKSFLRLITDKKQAGKFVDSAKTGKNKVPAIIVGADLKLIMGADGKTPLTVDEAISREARTFNATDILKAEDHYQQTMGIQWRQQQGLEELNNRYTRLLYNVSSFAEMRANASAQQLARITQAESQIQTLVAQLSAQKAQLESQRRSTLQANPTANVRGIQQQIELVDQELRAITEKPTFQSSGQPPSPQPAAAAPAAPPTP
ncbi:MAG TPA: hypothetical protein VJ553_01670 [Candidatus Paceibacterota bacterium]|nr:hypothetical protein [Candidatus Paceibacterota bacterium]